MAERKKLPNDMTHELLDTMKAELGIEDPVVDENGYMRKNGRWVKGQSGNPNGRPPKGECLTDILRAYIFKPTPGKKPKLRYEILCEKAWELVEKYSDIRAIMWIFDRIDGKPRITATVNREVDDETATEIGLLRDELQKIYGDKSEDNDFSNLDETNEDKK